MTKHRIEIDHRETTSELTPTRCHDIFTASPASENCYLDGKPIVGQMNKQPACIINAHCGRNPTTPTSATYLACESLYMQADHTLWVFRCPPANKLLKDCQTSWDRGSAQKSCDDPYISTKGDQCTITANCFRYQGDKQLSTINFSPCQAIENINGNLKTNNHFPCPYPPSATPSPSPSASSLPPSPHRFNNAGIVIAGLAGAVINLIFLGVVCTFFCQRPKRPNVSYSRSGRPRLLFADGRAGTTCGLTSSAGLEQ